MRLSCRLFPEGLTGKHKTFIMGEVRLDRDMRKEKGGIRLCYMEVQGTKENGCLPPRRF